MLLRETVAVGAAAIVDCAHPIDQRVRMLPQRDTETSLAVTTQRWSGPGRRAFGGINECDQIKKSIMSQFTAQLSCLRVVYWGLDYIHNDASFFE